MSAALASAPALRDTRWMPPGPGFYRATVLDAGGHAAQAVVRVTGGKQGAGNKPPSCCDL